MTEPKDLLLINEQLRRSNRRWKTLALTACATLTFVLLLGFIAVYTAQVRANRELREANAALARAHQARVDAQRAANPGQPR
jgi:type VI protein secretion system component VasK